MAQMLVAMGAISIVIMGMMVAIETPKIERKGRGEIIYNHGHIKNLEAETHLLVGKKKEKKSTRMLLCVDKRTRKVQKYTTTTIYIVLS